MMNIIETQSWLIRALVILGFLVVLAGSGLLFLDVSILSEKGTIVSLMSALFSLAGIFFFCAALVYQIKAFKLQAEELKNSVEAQRKSSTALEEQKNILLEQSMRSTMLELINSFTNYKDKPEIQESVKNCYQRYAKKYQELYANLKTQGLGDVALAKSLAENIVNDFNESIKTDIDYSNVRRFVQFGYNIFYLIDENTEKAKVEFPGWFQPYVHNLLLREEALVIYLFNLIPFGGPLYFKLRWTVPVTKELMEMIGQAVEDESSSFLVNLTEELNLKMQRNSVAIDSKE